MGEKMYGSAVIIVGMFGPMLLIPRDALFPL
jgi:hypothetical protein